MKVEIFTYWADEMNAVKIESEINDFCSKHDVKDIKVTSAFLDTGYCKVIYTILYLDNR